MSSAIIKNIITNFQIDGTIKSIEPIYTGHINDTYKIINSDHTKDDYLLQKINHRIFSDVGALMQNIKTVTEHVNLKRPGSTLTLISTEFGHAFYTDQLESNWRLCKFMKGLASYDSAETNDQVYQGALAFGRFLSDTSDIDPSSIKTTIPDFHSADFRAIELVQAVSHNPLGRLKYCQDLVNSSFDIFDQVSRIEKAVESREIEFRVTHNDTKFNNVLLDETNGNHCVIDLETLMPGLVHFDFGDGVRTSITTSAEDENDVKNIIIDIDRFTSFAQGYLEGCNSCLNKSEIDYLSLSGALLSYLMGVRFLTDYLMGDRYYRTHYEDQNLCRAMAQLYLAEALLIRQDDLEEIIKHII